MSQNSRVVLVVGASSGIGKSAAEELQKRGHVVYGTSRDASRVTSPGVKGVSMELGDEASVKQAVQSVLDAEGRLDATFYAAGFYVAGAVEETTPEQVHEQLDAYMVGVHRLTRAVLPHFRQAGSGRIIAMSSTAGNSSLPFHVIYSVSKAALQAYCEGLRYEVEPFGVQVAYLHAGGVKTGAKASFRRAAEPIDAYDVNRERAIEAFHRMQDKGPIPVAVGRAVVKAVEARRMKSVYRVDFFSKILSALHWALPESLFRSQVRKSLDI